MILQFCDSVSKQERNDTGRVPRSLLRNSFCGRDKTVQLHIFHILWLRNPFKEHCSFKYMFFFPGSVTQSSLTIRHFVAHVQEIRLYCSLPFSDLLC